MNCSTLDWHNQCNNHFLFSAHVWFGNYVTQRWWNDLWIKESISTYLAADCLAGLAEKFRNSSDSVIYMLNTERNPAVETRSNLATFH
jgi:aminopeptidase N